MQHYDHYSKNILQHELQISFLSQKNMNTDKKAGPQHYVGGEVGRRGGGGGSPTFSLSKHFIFNLDKKKL